MLVGTAVTVTVTFRDAAGGLADPTAVVVQVKSPSAVVSTVAMSPTAVGVYEGDVEATEPGIWLVKATGTGTLTVVGQSSFSVDAPSF